MPNETSPILLAKTPASQQAAPSDTETAGQRDGRHDFDFLLGRWTVEHRRLRERLVACTEWDTFIGETECRHINGGLGNVDDNWIDFPDGAYRAASIRLFDPTNKVWSIWWADARHGPLDTPVVGAFDQGQGTFTTKDVLNGQPIEVRFTWDEMTDTTARWHQAFSFDNGTTWERNWFMHFRRAQP